MKIVVPDLGISNLWSVRRALEALGHEVQTASGPEPIAGARLIVLPGVGAFAEAAARLEARRIGPAVLAAAAAGARILGICLGMQLLFESSDEGGESRGLGLLPGRVTRLSGTARLPHVGWNRVVATPKGAALFEDRDGSDFYFVHSFVARPTDDDLVLARSLHGESFPAAVGNRSVLGFQFHPEKSGEAGLALLGAAIDRLSEEPA